ncbi:hypothetical protein [Streptomyces sp. NPDC005533]|uniref:hypothetical protein n=1 Tax=Streptomyces sp. NPDC005533 TaxID=3364723 RepID=UPI0036AAB4AC
MATVITSTALSTADGTGSAIACAAAAGSSCLQQAGLTPADVDVLINVGVYRDATIPEPALAALIQKHIGINLGYLRAADKHTAFSLDLMNGADGGLKAVQVSRSLLAAGARRVLVVSAATHPPTDPAQAGKAAFPYASTGSALLLEHSDDACGFGRVLHRKLSGSRGINGYLPLYEVGSGGRNAFSVERDLDLEERLLALGVDSIRGCLTAEYGTEAAYAPTALDRTLLITCQPSPVFASRLAQRLGIASDAAVTVQGLEGDPPTSALTYGFWQAQDAGRFAGHDQILFLAVGAGLSSAASLYRLSGESESAAC